MFRGGAKPITARMQNTMLLTYMPDAEAFPHAEPFAAAVAEDTFVLAGQLADAIEIMMQCTARNVPLSDDFLAYVDELMEEIQAMQPGGAVHLA